MEKRLHLSLFLLRVGIFTVMFMWTLDKFIRPEHASKVYETFYHSPPFGSAVSYFIGGVEMALIFAFLGGIKKTLSYGCVLLFHLVSTVSSYPQYLAPFEGVNLLFFAAIPMLAGCFTLFLLRKEDIFLAVE